MQPEKPRSFRWEVTSGVVPGRYDLTVSVYREWSPGRVGLSSYWRHFTVYVSFLPVARYREPLHGRHWRRAWIFGRVRRGKNLHLGPVGFIWTK